MSTNVVWPIAVDEVQDLVRVKFKLEFPASVWACGLSEDGDYILVAMEIDNDDLSRLGVEDIELYNENEALFN
jgi:hypothetical protein